MDIRKLEGPYEILSIDPWLAPHAGDIELRMNRFKEKRWQIAGDAPTLDFTGRRMDGFSGNGCPGRMRFA